MQFCLDFRISFFIEWVLKSEWHWKEKIAKSSNHFSLADGMMDRGRASAWTLGEFFFKF
jgi:hypothetical protein